MKPKKDWLIVKVDLAQKRMIEVDGKEFLVATKFNTNYREKNPVVSLVIEGCNEIKKNDIIISHHNFFVPNSPFQIDDETFAIKYNENIFCSIDKTGIAHPLCDNVLAKKIKVDSKFALPVSCQKDYLDRAEMVEGGGYATGEIVFVKPYRCYEIVYVFNNIEHRIIKLRKTDIVANLKN